MAGAYYVSLQCPTSPATLLISLHEVSWQPVAAGCSTGSAAASNPAFHLLTDVADVCMVLVLLLAISFPWPCSCCCPLHSAPLAVAISIIVQNVSLDSGCVSYVCFAMSSRAKTVGPILGASDVPNEVSKA